MAFTAKSDANLRFFFWIGKNFKRVFSQLGILYKIIFIKLGIREPAIERKP